MKASCLCAAAIIFNVLATSAPAAVMQVSLTSRASDFEPVFSFFYPDLVSGEADLWADFRYDTDTWEASGLFSIGGYTDSFSGMAAIADNTGALLTSMPSADPSAFGVFGIWFDGSNGDGSHFSLSMSATQDTSASFSVPGTFDVAPYGYSTFGSTTGGTVAFGLPADVAAAPIPAALPLFGVAVVGVGLGGYAARRRRRVAM